MVLCEQFIFTSVDLEKKSGYQVVSKSIGITIELLSKLEGYLYPIGINPNKLSESQSMLVIDDKIAFTKSKNIGIGYDGRPDTVYSHTIIIAIEDFKKLHYDTRIFDEFYLETKEQKHLTPITVEPTKIAPDFSCIDVLGIAQFNEFLRAVFEKKSIAVINIENKNLIQSLISLLPTHFRLISFSTLVAQPHRQSRFELIQTQSPKSTLEKYFIIDPKERKQISLTKNTLFGQCINYLLDIIDLKNSDKLTKIYDEIESMPIITSKEKVSLVIGTLLLDPKKPLLLDQLSIKELLNILDKTPPKITSVYFPKLKPFLQKNIIVEYSKKYENSKIISHNEKNTLTYDIIVKMFGEQSNGTSESRLFLFNQLVKIRKKDLTITGSKILVDSVNDFYNKDIILGFVINNELEQCIFDALENPQVKINLKQTLFTMLVKSSVHHNFKLLEKLFVINLYNFENYEDIESFKNIIKELFEMDEFHLSLKPTTIFLIIKQIHDRVIPKFPKKEKSETIENNHYYLQDILAALLNMLRYLLTRRKHELGEIKQGIKKLELNLISFLDLNKLPKQINSVEFNIFELPFILSWNVFSRLMRNNS